MHNVMYKVSSVPSAIRVKHYQKFSIYLIFACKIITLRNYVNVFNVSYFFSSFFPQTTTSRKPDHFVVHQGWSLTRELTVPASTLTCANSGKMFAAEPPSSEEKTQCQIIPWNHYSRKSHMQKHKPPGGNNYSLSAAKIRFTQSKFIMFHTVLVQRPHAKERKKKTLCSSSQGHVSHYHEVMSLV